MEANGGISHSLAQWQEQCADHNSVAPLLHLELQNLFPCKISAALNYLSS